MAGKEQQKPHGSGTRLAAHIQQWGNAMRTSSSHPKHTCSDIGLGVRGTWFGVHVVMTALVLVPFLRG